MSVSVRLSLVLAAAFVAGEFAVPAPLAGDLQHRCAYVTWKQASPLEVAADPLAGKAGCSKGMWVNGRCPPMADDDC